MEVPLFFLHKLLQGGSFLSSSRNTLCFFAVVILFSALAALGGVTIFYWFDVIPQSVLFSVFFSFWAGDMTGLLMLAPIAFVVAGAWKEKQTGHLFRKSIRSMNWSRMFALLIPAVFSSAFFLYIIHRPDMAMYGYLIFIPLIWVAATHGAILASLAALISNLASAGVYSWMEASVYTTNQLHLVFAVGAAIALYLGVARDDRLRAESRAVEQESVLAEMSKMASLGELSNTIAHEIATPLQVASSNLQMSIRQLSRSKQVDTTQMLSYQHETQYALKKAIEIHHRVRQSAGKQSVSGNSRACLLKVVDEAKGLLNRNLTQSGTKVIVTSEKIASARIDETSMLQVFVNLFKNSITAMETESSKQKQIHCQITQQREKLIVNVFDTGPGFASGQAERVFDSFYTTKEDGLGLGLSICRTILEGVGGNIRIEQSQLGAHFVITLPIYEEVA
jgi:signal transduction histidine kinase